MVYSNAYGGSGLANVQKTNFAPRFGFAYQATSHLVVRGGYGMFSGAFENRGGYPSLGYNYPFQYSFYYYAPNSQSPMVLPNGQIGTLENSVAGIPLNPSAGSGIGPDPARHPVELQNSLRARATISRCSTSSLTRLHSKPGMWRR